MPLIPVLISMERAGVKLDVSALNQYAEVLKNEISHLENEIFDLAGVEFNISSPKQLGEILFDRLKIVDGAKRTKTKQYSTSEDVLIKLTGKHEIVSKVLEYRSLKKLLSTYVEALPALINPKTGHIHTSFNQAIASTGRLSSVNPNLQNIPIRDEKGREVRKAFIPSGEDYLLLSADYSQIELRLMAHMSEDEDMIQAFQNNEDIHTATAAKIYNIPTQDVMDLRHFLAVAEYPLAVRSSSLLEDSHYQPFAGIFDTHFLPNNHALLDGRLERLLAAIKLIYASVYSGMPNTTPRQPVTAPKKRKWLLSCRKL